MNRFCRFRQTITFHRWLVLVLVCALAPLVRPARAQAVLVLQPGNSVVTLAGNGADGAVKTGSSAQSPLGTPRSVAYDAAGNLYIADARNHQVLRVDGTGKLTVIAGTGRQGFAGDSGPATSAELNTPAGLAIDPAGNIFIADSGNQRVRRIAAVDSTISTVAGSGLAGFSGDGGPAVAAALRAPGALTVDSTGALYIADRGNRRVRKLVSDGTIATLAGNGQEGDAGDGNAALAASFGALSGLAINSNGQLLIADAEARRVRALNADGTISAYSVGALPLRRPAGVAATGDVVYLADAALQTASATSADGTSAVVGTGEQGALRAGNPLQTPLDTPQSIAAGPAGTFAIADAHNHQVQQVQASSLNFGSVPAGGRSAAQSVTLLNGGQSLLTVTALQLPAAFTTLPSGSTCAQLPFTLQPGRSCTLALLFAPTLQGPADALAKVSFSGGAPQSLLLRGVGAPNGWLASSATALRSDGTIAYTGSTVTFSATVTGQLSTQPIGNVTFLDGTTPLQTGPLAGSTATFSTASLSPGPHALQAVYAGDAVYSTSTSAAVSVMVVQSPDFTLSSSAASYSGKAGQSMTVPLTVLPVNGTLNQAVQIAVTGLPSGATATFTPSTFVLGGTATAVAMAIQMPTTLAAARPFPLPAVTLTALMLPFLYVRRRRWASGLGMLRLLAATLWLSGCGSGFKPGVTPADLNGGTRSYTVVVTATTTGVQGTPLAHSTSVGLVISK